MKEICRPEKLTERWISEMSEALNKVCGFQPLAFDFLNRKLDDNWNAYWHNFNQQFSKCKNPDRAQRIIDFSEDYRDV